MVGITAARQGIRLARFFRRRRRGAAILRPMRQVARIPAAVPIGCLAGVAGPGGRLATFPGGGIAASLENLTTKHIDIPENKR